MKLCCIACAAGAFALLISCSSPPPDTREADAKAIKDMEAAWMRDINTKDAEKWLSHLTEDASFLVSGAPIANGKEAIRSIVKSIISDPNFALSFSSTKVEVAKSGDIGYSVGMYSLTTSDPNTKVRMVDTGKYLTTFKKQADGSWKATADMINSDAPPPAPPPAKPDAAATPPAAK
jgi:uncharacterized protein (TIGR02246 family)